MNPVETPAAATDPAAPEVPAPERPCPRCGAALTPEQDWCLACGTAVTTDVQRPPSWRLPLAIVASVVLLAGLALTFAFLELADDPDQLAAAPSPTPAATAPPATPTPDPAATPTPEAGATPTPDDDAATGEPEAGATPAPDAGAATPEPGDDDSLPTPTPDDGATGTPDPDAGTGADPGTGTIADWPAGETAWTVVLFSGRSREEAETKAEGFAAGGTPVGILRSDDYESLNAGYHVVFSGQYETRREAQDAAEDLQATASGAYARRVRPR